MGYILILLAIIGTIMSFTLHTNPLAGVFRTTRANIVEYVTPRTQTEIIIEKLQPQHRTLEEFFTTTAPRILQSQTTSPQERKEVEQAIAAFQQSEQAIVQIQQAERAETGITESLIKKVLGDTSSTTASPTPSSSVSVSPTPPGVSSTPLPPQCRIECN